MAQSNLASDKRRPGTFHFFDDTSGARSLIPIDKTIALVAVKTAAGTATSNVPILASNEAEAETYAGKGSMLSLMARKAFATMRKLNFAAKVYLVPLDAPAGVANVRTFTFTGTATANGDIVLRIAGRTIRVPVKSGDVQNTVAASAKAAIDPFNSDLPGTATVATNVVTFTWNTTGVNGNDMLVEVVSTVAGVTVAAAQTVAGSGAATIATALDALASRDYLIIALSNHTSTDVTALGTHLDAMWAAAKKRYRHAIMGETSTLATATTLAAAANRKDILVAGMEASPSLPGEIAASVGVMLISHDRPSHNYDGTELPLYAPSDTYVFDDAEIESALSGGVVPLSVTDSGAVRVERAVTTKTTVGGIRFENLLDYSNSATSAFYARQIDARFTRAIQGQSVDADFLKDLRDIGYDVLKQGEAIGDLHHVDEHAGEIVVESHPTIPSRILAEIPESVMPNAHQIDVTHRLFVEGA